MAGGEMRNRRALGDIGNLVIVRGIDGKKQQVPQASRPATRIVGYVICSELVVISHDVDPIKLVVWLPALVHYAGRWKFHTALSRVKHNYELCGLLILNNTLGLIGAANPVEEIEIHV